MKPSDGFNMGIGGFAGIQRGLRGKILLVGVPAGWLFCGRVGSWAGDWSALAGPATVLAGDPNLSGRTILGR